MSAYEGKQGGRSLRLRTIPTNVLWAAIAIAAPAPYADSATASVGVLQAFNQIDGGYWPQVGVIKGSDGNYYGTTFAGGYRGGTVFQMTPSRRLTYLYRFGTVPGDGAYPRGPLVEGSDGNFYGTTTYDDSQGDGFGTVFKITPSGILTTLHTFTAVGDDGGWPSGVVEGNDGNLYGTTDLGGTNNLGTVFKITPEGTLTTLYSFGTVRGDGAYGAIGLVLASDGNFYSATGAGGAYNDGTIFKITPSGSLTTLYTFGKVASAGARVGYSLIEGSDGNFYGTNLYGGAYNKGTVFRITPSGYLTTLYAFGASANDGWTTSGSLLEGSDGNFYATNFFGGAHQSGTAYEITPDGSMTTLYAFGATPSDGSYPYGTLIQNANGSFIGTTEQGGNAGGTIFEMKVTQPGPPGVIAKIGVQPSGKDAKLSWTVSANSTSYTVLQGTTPDAEQPVAQGLTTRRYTAENLASGTTYYFKVVGSNPAGTGPESKEVSVTVQ